MRNEDYRKTFEEFINKFQNEEDCIDYILRLRWPNGFVCPRCQSTKEWKTSRDLMHCVHVITRHLYNCWGSFSKDKKPLRLWFHVMWWMMSQKTGASARNLKNAMGFGSYKTTWAWFR